MAFLSAVPLPLTSNHLSILQKQENKQTSKEDSEETELE
jgi:hypothetical protein